MKIKTICAIGLLCYGVSIGAMDSATSTYGNNSSAQSGVKATAVRGMNAEIVESIAECELLLSEYARFIGELEQKIKQKLQSDEAQLSEDQQERFQLMKKKLDLLSDETKMADGRIRKEAIELRQHLRLVVSNAKGAALFGLNKKDSQKSVIIAPVNSAARRKEQETHARKAAQEQREKQRAEARQRKVALGEQQQAKLEQAKRLIDEQEALLDSWESALTAFETAAEEVQHDTAPFIAENRNYFASIEQHGLVNVVNRVAAATPAISHRSQVVDARLKAFMRSPSGAFLLGSRPNPFQKPAAVPATTANSIPAQTDAVNKQRELEQAQQAVGGASASTRSANAVSAPPSTNSKQTSNLGGSAARKPTTPATTSTNSGGSRVSKKSALDEDKGKGPSSGGTWLRRLAAFGVGATLAYFAYQRYASQEKGADKKSEL